MTKRQKLINKIEELNNNHLKVLTPLMDELNRIDDLAIEVSLKKNYYKKLSNEEIKLVIK